MEKHIYFVRHGESTSNADGLHRGEDAALTEKGLQQAHTVADRIQKIGVEAIISSTFPRAVETAKPTSARLHLPIEQSPLFVEMRRPSLVIGRHKNDPEVMKVADEVFEGYSDSEHRHSDEENLSDLHVRAAAALELLATHPKNRLCVVTHGAFMRALLCSAVYGATFSGHMFQRAMNAMRIDNTGITYFRYGIFREDKPQWVVMSWNDSAHLG